MLGWLGSHISLLSFRFHSPVPGVIPRQVLPKIVKLHLACAGKRAELLHKLSWTFLRRLCILSPIAR